MAAGAVAGTDAAIAFAEGIAADVFVIRCGLALAALHQSHATPAAARMTNSQR